ncbi:ATP-binding protein [Jannaschia sp. W003]|uniref:ATP-binding protein n=1 Tax=Jannaschia sp. W003 TaxID=2867012 RepID=UPI0021A4C012|nr:ATP-binding protein [Jannaschia sp. W003]UWQ20432.1 HAMP domain-containing protein [Jannaschia sp. W003]
MAFSPQTRAQSRRWLPRSFYARAALILIVPVLTIQLAVAVLFLQRHVEDVTASMTATMARQVALVRTHPELAALLGIFEAEAPDATRIRIWDLGGRVMRARLAEALPDLAAVDTVAARKEVRLGFADGTGLAFPRDAVSAPNPHQLIVWMVAVALVATAISVLFMRGQIRPIRRLAAAAEAFGRGQHADFWSSGSTEVRQAGTAFLAMRARIERHIEQRTLLLSGVSHDLRTPLTRMKLELGMMDGPEAEALAGDVRAMERIIDTFLDFARAGATDALAPHDLTALVREAVSLAAPEAEVPVSGPEGVVMPVLPEGLRRAVANLVGNALRYGRRVRVEVSAGAAAAIVAVEDDGPGIPDGDRDAAMRPFSRLDAARGSTEGNVGLGLAIVRDIARAHGGTLRLGDSPLGGLKAEVVLPR